MVHRYSQKNLVVHELKSLRTPGVDCSKVPTYLVIGTLSKDSVAVRHGQKEIARIIDAYHEIQRAGRGQKLGALIGAFHR